MEPSKKITPAFFFLSIGTVAALITTVSAFLKVTFDILNRVFPDILTDSYRYGYANYSYESLRSSLALLIIIFPIYLLLEHFWQKVLIKENTQHNETLKKWAIYLVLFLASVTIITDLVVLVRYFVSGEITVRFILKVALTLIVAGLVGLFYFRKLRLQFDSKRQLFTVISALLVLAAIIYAFVIMGAPASQRKLRIDERRRNDLQSIQWQIISYWQRTETLPNSLEDLSDPISSYMVPQDPEFMKGMKYEYEKKGALTFSLCATFALPMPKGFVPDQGYGGGFSYPTRSMVDVSMPSPIGGDGNVNWDHEAGRACFDRTIDPKLYPPNPKPQPL